MNFSNLELIESYLYKKIENFLNARNLYRKLILIFLDYFCIYFSWLLSIYILKDSNNLNSIRTILYHFWSIQLLALPIYIFTKQYKPLTRFINTSSFYSIIARNIFLILLPIVYLDIARFKRPEITFWIIFLVIVFFTQIGYRFFIKDLINNLLKSKINKNRKRAAIYRANFLGFQLSNLLQIEGDYEVVCFLDNSPSLSGSSINSIPIKNISKFNNKIEKIEELIIASEDSSFYKYKEFIKKFESQGINVLYLTPLQYLRNKDKFKDTNINLKQKEILGRPKVEPSKSLLKASINNEISVCITGAGGSIGSELCRQIINMEPKYLIMIDFCEYNLFKINQELEKINTKKTTLITQLKNAEDELSLEETFKKYTVNLIFHAAAYKHVEMVEKNPLDGLRNNLLNTKSICNAAIKTKVKKMILISSDKAVRPTNIMGGSKLLSELIVKSYAHNKKSSTKFAVVRFGNVIDSSGSVIPIFRKQIKNGGPITVTHPDMERFFMTISEAVQLVLQSSVLSVGGETFLLNMGQPVKIIDIAKKMIFASGLKIKDSKNKNGDIEIKIIGIKKGEKLKEELLINGKIVNTAHPLIHKAEEILQINPQLLSKINRIIDLAKSNNTNHTLKNFYELIDQYK